MITHDYDSLYSICDKVAILAEKRIIAVVPVAELLEVDDPWIKSIAGEVRCRRPARMAEERLETGQPQTRV
jgi:phospholipid/cholesterol/gamma-HCH transport system ATP-binding protein